MCCMLNDIKSIKAFTTVVKNHFIDSMFQGQFQENNGKSNENFNFHSNQQAMASPIKSQIPIQTKIMASSTEF